MQSEAHVGQWLRLAHQAQSRAVDLERVYGLTNAQFAVLAAVISNPGLDQRGINAVTFLARSMLPAVISRLVARRLLSASRNPLDARRGHLVATEAAVALMYEVNPQVVERNDELLEILATDARPLFLRALEAVGTAERDGLPDWHHIPSPDGVRPPLHVPWGLGRRLRAAMQRYGRVWGNSVPTLTMLQWLTLVELDGAEDVDQRAVGASIRLDKATTSVMLNRLSGRGLVERVEDHVDRRRRILHLTEEGRRQLTTVRATATDVGTRFLTPLDDEGRRHFLDGIRLLAAQG